MTKGSMLKPLKALSQLFKAPITLPMEPRPAADNYRGFHINDWQACIGCGTCEKICDNAAIRMIDIPNLPADPEHGKLPRRPAIDYGRCCWCALCVDICPTGSISLSKEYVHVSPDPNTFYILPDEKGMHGLGFDKGWSKSDDADLLDHDRQAMDELSPETRVHHFDEIVAGFDDQAALVEASRCIQCGMCHEACPTHMHAPDYIRDLWKGDLESAVENIYRTNPLGSVCGRVCTHRCETACSIGKRGDPVAIRWLKRYALDQLPRDRIISIATQNKSDAAAGLSIGIIGAGPAGLTTAYDMALQGADVHIYDAYPEAGGMMRYGIPEYRLPYPRLDEDVEIIKALGVSFHMNTRVGADIPMDQLREQHDHVLLAIGLHQGRSTRIPGTEHQNVISAIELLRDVTLGTYTDIPKEAIIIGGGNVAMDAARTLARLQTQTYGKVNVILTALEAREQMLADEEEIREAEEEGVIIIDGRGPRVCLIENDAITGLETVRCLSLFDDEGRFHPKYDDTDVQVHQGELIVEAIGQASDVSLLGDELTEALNWIGPRIHVDEQGRTNIEGLYAAGDMVEGPDVIHAVAAGHRVAQAMIADRRQHVAA